MKAIGRLGTAALGILLPTERASACTDSWIEYHYYCEPGAFDRRCKQTRSCKQCTGGQIVCTGWSAPSCYYDSTHC